MAVFPTLEDFWKANLAIFKISSAKVVNLILLELETLIKAANGPSGFDISEKYQSSVFRSFSIRM